MDLDLEWAQEALLEVGLEMQMPTRQRKGW